VIVWDPNVKAVLFNIFGGITRCDEVARGLIEAFEQIKPTIPFVVRLDGTNGEEGRATAPGGRAAERACGEHDGRGGCARRRACPMSVIVDSDTRLCVSGITGREGSFHSLNNRAYGTNVVSGVTPGKGGQDVEGIPVFNTFHAAVAATQANTAMIFVPPPFAADSILEAAESGITTIIAITEGIPAHDEFARLHAPAAHPAGAPDRSQLSRRAVSRQGETSASSRRRSFARAMSGWYPARNAHLPGRQRVGAARLRQLLDRRHRRRPGTRVELSLTSSTSSRPTPKPS